MGQSKLHPLRRRLMELGKTQNQFAKEIGVKPQAVSGYMAGGLFSPSRVRAIANSLDCATREVLNFFTQDKQWN